MPSANAVDLWLSSVKMPPCRCARAEIRVAANFKGKFFLSTSFMGMKSHILLIFTITRDLSLVRPAQKQVVPCAFPLPVPCTSVGGSCGDRCGACPRRAKNIDDGFVYLCYLRIYVGILTLRLAHTHILQYGTVVW